MPAIIAQCPGCQAKYTIKDPKLFGKKIKCRKCKTGFRIKAPSASAAVAEGESATPEDLYADFNNYEEDDEFSNIQQLPPPRRPATKKKETESGVPEEGQQEEKKKKKAPPNPIVLFGLIGAGIVTLTLLVLGGIFLPGMVKNFSNGAQIDVPQKFVHFSHRDSPFQFDYPEGWELKHGGGERGAAPYARVDYKGVRILIRGASVGQRLSQAGVEGGGASFAGSGATRLEADPVHTLHLDELDRIVKKDPDYTESSPQEIFTGFGGGRISEFTEPGIFGTTYGYRVTMPPFTTVCSGSKKQFAAMKDTFKKIIESIEPDEVH